MSLLRLILRRNCDIITKSVAIPSNSSNTFKGSSLVTPAISTGTRFLSLTVPTYCENQEGETKVHTKYNKPGRDRSQIIPVETSIEYLRSEPYRELYGENPVWFNYRRVHKGHIPSRKTRESCIRFKVITTASPCPICRDEFLVLDHRNLTLLRQFISPHTGEVLPFAKTGLCQKQHRNLLVSLERAYDLGTLEYQVPFRSYDYELYYNFKKAHNVQ